jgi:hypothetical protein
MNVDAPIEESGHSVILPYVNEFDAASARWLSFGFELKPRRPAMAWHGGLDILGALP